MGIESVFRMRGVHRLILLRRGSLVTRLGKGALADYIKVCCSRAAAMIGLRLFMELNVTGRSLHKIPRPVWDFRSAAS